MASLPLVITFPFSPILAQAGPLTIRWYGLGYAVAFLVGLMVAGRHLRDRGIEERQYGDMAFWAIVLGLILARLYFVVQSGVGWYVTHPEHILAFWEGGMAFYGALFFVPIFLFLYSRWKHLSWWVVADAGALFAAVGQPIGRIGNIFNGDIIGYPSNLPWAIRYTDPQTLAPEIGVGYQPAAAYELLLGVLILLALLGVRRWVRPPAGALFLLYLLLYAITQFFVFFVRANSITLFGLKQAQLSSIVLVLITAALTAIWLRSRPRGSDAGAAREEPGGAGEAGGEPAPSGR
jgi:phosphatidylglycerol:prolipoprotein diacylglycerol transferase